MDTLYLNPATDEGALDRAARLLRKGEVVGMPTETVYGLAANALDAAAVKKIFDAKGRPQDNPLIVHFAQIEQLPTLCAHIPPMLPALARAFWPGPLTLIVPKAACIPSEVSCSLPTVGLRLPSHPIARALIEKAGVPLAAPSANRSGKPSTTTAQHVLHDLAGRIAAVVEGGESEIGLESTVLSLVGDQPRLLRPGGITREQLQSVIGPVILDRALFESIDDTMQVSAPGMKYRHYAPDAPLTVVQGPPHATAAYIAAHVRTGDGVLCFEEYRTRFAHCTVHSLGGQEDVAAQAHRLFDCLRAFDAEGVSAIWAQCPCAQGLGLAIFNRIGKAAGFRTIVLE